MAEKQLPLSISTFAALRSRENKIYVDKTELIADLAEVDQAQWFLSRPRRFGKTLLVSTFESLFRHGLRDFSGLALEKRWHDKQYPVIRLDFSSCKDFKSLAEFEAAAADMFDIAFAAAGVKLEAGQSFAMNPFGAFAKYLALQPVVSLVLLIDEYDAPLSSHLDDPTLFDDVRRKLSTFYSNIKAYSGCLRFLFVTGILRFRQASIFSTLNTLTDLSLEPAYGTLLGYTREEIEVYFGNYLDRAEKVCGLSRCELMEQLARYYDGFCFDQKARTHVFSPWSVLNFLRSPENGFENYWYESAGTSSLLMNYLQQHSLQRPEEYDVEQTVSVEKLKDVVSPEMMSDVVLLAQTGYLTIKSVEDSVAVLGYPNEEVKRSMARLYSDRLLGDRSPVEIAGRIGEKLARGSAEEVLNSFNALFARADYQYYPITSESICRACLQFFLEGAGLAPRIEVHSYRGRSDLEVSVAKRQWVFELKFARQGEDESALLDKAISQMRSRDYGRGSAEGRERLRVALVFSEPRRQFVQWRVVQDED